MSYQLHFSFYFFFFRRDGVEQVLARFVGRLVGVQGRITVDGSGCLLSEVLAAPSTEQRVRRNMIRGRPRGGMKKTPPVSNSHQNQLYHS